jgi:hypothetical protein
LPAGACRAGLIPAERHTAGQDPNNPAEADHGRLKARLRPMRGLKPRRSARSRRRPRLRPNLRRGHYHIATGTSGRHRLRAAFDSPRTNHLTSGHLDHAPPCAYEDHASPAPEPPQASHHRRLREARSGTAQGVPATPVDLTLFSGSRMRSS